MFTAALLRPDAGFAFETEYNNFLNYFGAPFVTFGYICGMVLIVSPWWLKRYRYGPLECLWQALTYRTWPRMRTR